MRKDRGDIRRAWERAAAIRSETDDGSDVVLLRMLTLEGIAVPTEGPAREALLAEWRRGTHPRLVPWRLVGRALGSLASPAKALWDAFRGAESPTLTFEPSDPADLQIRCQDWPVDEYAPNLRFTRVELVDAGTGFSVLHAGVDLGRALADEGEPAPGPGTLYVAFEEGRLDPEHCWIDQD